MENRSSPPLRTTAAVDKMIEDQQRAATLIVRAFSQVVRGSADGPAQRKAMKHIMRVLCGVTDYPQADADPYKRAFDDGRRYVGLKIAELAALRHYSDEENEE